MACRPSPHPFLVFAAGFALATSLMLVSGPAISSQVTTERILSVPDFSATSPDLPATLGPNGEDSGTSGGSIDGETTGEAPTIGSDGLAPLNEAAHEVPAGPPPKVLRDLHALPAPVRRMHKAIYDAAISGNIESLRMAVEMNEMPPILGLEPGSGDSIEQIRQMAGDPQGSEILAILAEILESGFVLSGQGTSEEMYVWPYFAQFPVSALSDRQRVELFRLITSYDYEEMDALGQYVFFRLGISADGTWHYFLAGE